jgi:hypothetical protein
MSNAANVIVGVIVISPIGAVQNPPIILHNQAKVCSNELMQTMHNKCAVTPVVERKAMLPFNMVWNVGWLGWRN